MAATGTDGTELPICEPPPPATMCSDYTCPDGYELIAAADTTEGDDDSTCCMEAPVGDVTSCTDSCVSTPGWYIHPNPVTTCEWMDHICAPMRRGECQEQGGETECQWWYLQGQEHQHQYAVHGQPAANCCQCQGFQVRMVPRGSSRIQ